VCPVEQQLLAAFVNHLVNDVGRLDYQHLDQHVTELFGILRPAKPSSGKSCLSISATSSTRWALRPDEHGHILQAHAGAQSVSVPGSLGCLTPSTRSRSMNGSDWASRAFSTRMSIWIKRSLRFSQTSGAAAGEQTSHKAQPVMAMAARVGGCPE